MTLVPVVLNKCPRKRMQHAFNRKGMCAARRIEKEVISLEREGSKRPINNVRNYKAKIPA
jgi:hypothetical protein